jgi:YebC/PmpR family DNA-binding regulatory protein
MAGHSKWANIQYRKGAQDKKRAKVFTKLIREITTAARVGGGDPATNPRLRRAIDEALTNNMPKDTVERATKRGTGELEGASLEEIRYEGYAPGGVAVMVDCLTDNHTRTVADVRHAFSKHGGNLGAAGSVGYLVSHCGVLAFPKGASEDRIMEVALEAGAEDVVTADDGTVEVITSPDGFDAVKAAMAAAKLAPESAGITMRAATEIPLDATTAPQVFELIEALEDLDDVQHVYSNAAFPDRSPEGGMA